MDMNKYVHFSLTFLIPYINPLLHLIWSIIITLQLPQQTSPPQLPLFEKFFHVKQLCLSAGEFFLKNKKIKLPFHKQVLPRPFLGRFVQSPSVSQSPRDEWLYPPLFCRNNKGEPSEIVGESSPSGYYSAPHPHTVMSCPCFIPLHLSIYNPRGRCCHCCWASTPSSAV